MARPHEVWSVERRDRPRLTGAGWFHRFCELYDSSAGSLLTELGIFYDRHRKFVEHGQLSDPSNPEYTDGEWNRVMATVLGELAGEMGLVQAPDPECRGQLEWYLPGVTDRPSVVIRSVSEATNEMLTRDLVELSRFRSNLSVFVMYPDYPVPEGSSTFDGAVREWRRRIQRRLAELRPERELVTLMISAYSFDVPAPWRGYLWNRASASLEPLPR